MENKELNKKLAEWAGFKKHKLYQEHSWQGWQDPTGFLWTGERPNFTNDLNACFKWLVPQGDIEKIIFTYFTTWLACTISLNNGEYVEGLANLGQEALALCLAFNKLIDTG